jgi:hypothetical protein
MTGNKQRDRRTDCESYKKPYKPAKHTPVEVTFEGTHPSSGVFKTKRGGHNEKTNSTYNNAYSLIYSFVVTGEI